MGSKREEERNEKIIRGLMKLPPNRRCINCNSLGPQYVCTTFWTFICMPCSGIHREFTHRVKSVSMAKFTSQEVDALQKGGNQRARELFLMGWDPQRQRLPDNSNPEKVREFIKNVYVDKRYAVEKSSERPPTDPQSIRSHEDEVRRASSYHSYSQSPPYDFQYEERRYGKPVPSLTRKPGSDHILCEGKFSSFSSPSRFSDHTNDEGFANEGSFPGASDYSASSGGDLFRSDVLSSSSQRETWSPFSETSSNFSSEIHGHHTVLHKSDANGGSNAGRIRRPQRTASSGSFGSFDSMSFRSENSMGLQELAAEAKQSIETSHDKTSSFHSLPQSSTSTTFNGLDLFNEAFAPQNFTSTPTTVSNSQSPELLLTQYIDLFQQSPISSVPTQPRPEISPLPPPQNFTLPSEPQSVASSNGKSSDVAMSQNGGWATFDVSQNLLPMGSENSVPVALSSSDGNNLGDLNPFSLDQSSSSQKFASHEPAASKHALWHDGLQNVETTISNTQLWSAFEDSCGKQPIEKVPKDRDRAAVLGASNANRSLGIGVYEDLRNDENFGAPYEIEPPSSLSPHLGMVLHDFSVVPEVAGLHSVASVHKPNNPFDLPCDAALESSNMTQYWDMSSLQATLPNNQTPSTYVGDANESWFPRNSVTSYIPGGVTFDPPNAGSLGFIAGQAPSAQISRVPAQGGNPFA